MKRSLTIRTILLVFRQHIIMTMALALVILAVVILSLIPPQLLKIIIDRNLVPKNVRGLPSIAFTYLGVLTLIGIFDFLKGGLLTVFGQKLIKNLRMELALKLERIGTTYFSANTSGMITSRFINDVENVNSLFADGAISMIIDCFKILGIVVSIWIFSAKLGILVLCLVPIIYVITRSFQKRMLTAQVQNLEQLSRVNSHISESLKNVHMIKAFSKEAYMEKLYQKRLEDNFHTIERVNFYDSCYAPIIQIIRALVIALIVILSSHQLNFLGISLGMVAASIDLLSNLFSPIETLGMELQNIQKGISGIQRINDFYLETEESEKSGTITADKVIGNERAAELIFEQITFSYEPGQPVLENLDLIIKQGSSVTFAGRTGVGKTTLFQLIMGLLKPASGRILLGGIDVYEIPNSEKRKIFGYVEQQFSFIRGTVAEQISLADENISREQVEEAMKFVGLHEYVMNLEHSYDTVVNQKEDFSQGQKQLLAIARAIVANPTVLLLDEITANLDSVTEAKIVTVLQKARCKRTVLSISHRITSMLDCDIIVLLENGRIRTTGSPTTILATDDWFNRQYQLEKNTWKN